ncbi:MAG TPA: thiamine pyrophosphate-dependent dehydrogenase E1 component subunit alpha [Vicinamibacteria bacterium]|nr:thiamine pyrophosphate-dependent dehydrogenase E1 component subunit alpha [Vicinamibacteria bacterium]
MSSVFKPIPPELDRLAIDPGDLSFDEDALVRMYRAMTLARTFETRLASLYRQGKIIGAVYLGIGQEAIATGVASVLGEGDVFSTVSRSLSAWFYRGVEPKHVMARWLGKDVPPAHGRDLGLFLADLENYGIAPYHNGSMASWIPSGAGFALAFKMKRLPNVYVAFTGDGATSPGDFYEGLNFASIHKLPLVIIAENNQFAYSTPIHRQMPVEKISDRAPAFNIYSDLAFGNDLFAVIRTAQKAIDHARRGEGPALVEFLTFRRRGHGEHDDASYVPEEMFRYWEQRDPVKLYVDYLTGRGGVSHEELRAVDEECARIVDEAVDYASAQPFPEPESVTERLFAPR